MGAVVHLDDPLATTEGCRYCWMCRHVCPVGHVTKRETLTPHGWALTIDSVSRGNLSWTAESVDVLYSCADCGMCRTHCVTDRPLPEAIAAARADVAAAGHAPKSVYALHEKLQRYSNPYVDRAPIAPRTPVGTVTDTTVAVFVGDAGTHLSPKTLDAAITLLRAAGLKPVPVGAGRSTGLLASSLGFPETATALARAVIAEVEAAGCRRVLTVSPGDRFAFERLYRERLDLTWPDSIVVEDATVVLAAALQSGGLTLRRRADVPAYAYHDPCHAPRIDRDAAAPRALLAAALGDASARRLFWREGRAHPCGATGGLEFTQPEIAASLADARLDDAVAAGAAWLITDDPGCLHHLRSRARDARPAGGTAARAEVGAAADAGTAGAPGVSGATGVEVHGLYELLAEQLQG